MGSVSNEAPKSGPAFAVTQEKNANPPTPTDQKLQSSQSVLLPPMDNNHDAIPKMMQSSPTVKSLVDESWKPSRCDIMQSDTILVHDITWGPNIIRSLFLNDHLKRVKGLSKQCPYTKLILESAIPRIIFPHTKDNEATKILKAMVNYNKVCQPEVSAATNRLHEVILNTDTRPVLLEQSIPSLTNQPNAGPAYSIATCTLSDYVSKCTHEQDLRRWNTYQWGQNSSCLGGINVYRNGLPKKKRLLLHTLLIGSCAGTLFSGVHLPGGTYMRPITGVLSTSAAVANIPMHMRTDYTRLRWGLIGFSLLAYAAFLLYLLDSLRGLRRPMYLFFALFGGMSAIGSTLFADKVDDTVQSILTFGPLALTLIAGLMYMPFRYGFGIGANGVEDVEMQAQPGR